MNGIWSQKTAAFVLILEMSVISAPLKVRLSMGCFENLPSISSMNAVSNFPLGVVAKEIILPTDRPYSSFTGLPRERKRLEG
jgi:hypothetical protein